MGGITAPTKAWKKVALVRIFYLIFFCKISSCSPSKFCCKLKTTRTFHTFLLFETVPAWHNLIQGNLLQRSNKQVASLWVAIQYTLWPPVRNSPNKSKTLTTVDLGLSIISTSYSTPPN